MLKIMFGLFIENLVDGYRQGKNLAQNQKVNRDVAEIWEKSYIFSQN